MLIGQRTVRPTTFQISEVKWVIPALFHLVVEKQRLQLLFGHGLQHEVEDVVAAFVGGDADYSTLLEKVVLDDSAVDGIFIETEIHLRVLTKPR